MSPLGGDSSVGSSFDNFSCNVAGVYCAVVVPRITLTHRCNVGDQCADVYAHCASTGVCRCLNRFHNLAGVCGMYAMNTWAIGLYTQYLLEIVCGWLVGPPSGQSLTCGTARLV